MNLKPCIWPQCRSTNVSIIENKGHNLYYGFCFDCEAHGPSAQTPEQAAEAWDNRPEFKWETPGLYLKEQGKDFASVYIEAFFDGFDTAREMKEKGE